MEPRSTGEEKQIRAHVRDMNDVYLSCRTLGHEWLRSGHFYIEDRTRPRIARMDIPCGTCGSTRIDRMRELRKDVWVWDGRVYDYAEGYLQHGSPDEGPAPKRDDYRAEMVRRHLRELR